MAARKKCTPPSQGEAGHDPKPAKKPTPLGTDPALTMTTLKGKSVVLTSWDLWFALVAVKDYAGRRTSVIVPIGTRSLWRQRPRGTGEPCAGGYRRWPAGGATTI
jgi:hypothetical protein